MRILTVSGRRVRELSTDGRRLIIEPVRQRRKRVLASAKRVMEAHSETFRKLAR